MPYCKRLSDFKPVTASLIGPDVGTKTYINNGPKLMGRPKETDVNINGVDTQALLHMGSSIGSIGHSFYLNSYFPLLPVTDI